MFKVEQATRYKAFGLSMMSEIPLPELSLMDNEADDIDIQVRIGDLTQLWIESSGKPEDFVIRERLVMFQIPGIATFAVQDGKTVTVAPMADYDEDKVRIWLLGTCMGAILMQRRMLPLHGSAVAIDGKAYAIVGDSGAGKSTLASAFLSRGYRLLTDDVIPVTFSEDRVPFVIPSYPQQKLWEESLQYFGMESSDYCPIYQRETKFAIPVPGQFSSEPLPLAGVFELVKADTGHIEILPIENLHRFHIIFCHTYRNFFIPRLGLMDWHFSRSSAIIGHIDMFQLRRPVSGFTAHDLVALILGSIKEERL